MFPYLALLKVPQWGAKHDPETKARKFILPQTGLDACTLIISSLKLIAALRQPASKVLSPPMMTATTTPEIVSTAGGLKRHIMSLFSQTLVI